MLTASAPSALAQGPFPYDECGEFIQGVSCILFEDVNGRQLLLDVDVSGQPLGVQMRVTGNFDPTCFTICLQGDGCVFNSVILACGPPPGNFPQFCNGDGGDGMGCTDCPCGNNAAPPSIGGCLNGVGTAAVLEASNSASVGAADLRMEVQGANPSTFGVLTSGDNRLPANMTNPCFGLDTGVISTALDGLRCIGQNLIRHGSRATDANGDIGPTNNGWGPPSGPMGGIAAQGGFVAGQTREFQVFYREMSTLVCQTGQNTTNGVTVQFVP